MSYTIQHDHDKVINKKVKSILKMIAKENNCSYLKVRDAFVIEQDMDLTLLFWKALYEVYPELEIYNNVNFCQGCRYFSLEIVNLDIH